MNQYIKLYPTQKQYHIIVYNDTKNVRGYKDQEDITKRITDIAQGSKMDANEVLLSGIVPQKQLKWT